MATKVCSWTDTRHCCLCCRADIAGSKPLLPVTRIGSKKTDDNVPQDETVSEKMMGQARTFSYESAVHKGKKS